MFTTVILFLIVIAILVLVHELGHFIVAKLAGIRVDEFGIGFPPKIIGKKWGSTLYTLNAIPFGGFVKIYGEDQHSTSITDADKATSFYYKPKWIQAAVLVAGVTFNVVFAWLLISLGFMSGMPAAVDGPNVAQVTNPQLIVTEVMKDSPAGKVGLKPGDEIVRVSSGGVVVEGIDVSSANVQELIAKSSSGLELTYKRGGDQEETVNIIPSKTIVPDRLAIGIAMEMVGILKLPIHTAFIRGAQSTWFILIETAKGLGQFLWQTVTFRSDFSQVAGPVGIAGAVSDANNLGFIYLLSLVALISINLAIINLVPFPALDGGRLLFVLIESITRRPISTAFVQRANIIGFSLLILFMLVVTVQDVLKLF